MLTLLSALRTFLDRADQEETGATAVEYGIMVALIAVAIIVTVTALGITLDGVFTTVNDALP